MKGDITRSTFQPEKHYSSVRMQQGRVLLDADWNEQADIVVRRIESEAADLIGVTGAPYESAGFGVVLERPGSQGPLEGSRPRFSIGRGHYYVNGILCENEANVDLAKQADFPNWELPEPVFGPRERWESYYIIYLDVWQRHITALDDESIREVALGSADTTTRTKTVWQVKVSNPYREGANEPKIWSALTERSRGKLSARIQDSGATGGPCIMPPGTGYRRMENQLYRVEIHESGPLGQATFKWSRENGSVIARWEEPHASQPGNTLTVSSLGRDIVSSFSPRDWVELIDDTRELWERPGVLVQLTAVEGQTLTYDTSTVPHPDNDGEGVDRNNFPRNPRIRRWDGAGGVAAVTIPAENQGWIELEDGVEIKFEAGGEGDEFQTGDYWLIPARIAGTVEWPLVGSPPQPEPRLPAGIEHHYSKLAIIASQPEHGWRLVQDCRRIFPPVTALTNMLYAGGDGQSAQPGARLLQPLQVRVVNGQLPVAGAKVRFEVGGGGSVPTAEVSTDATGIAKCEWTLGSEGQNKQSVKAVLLDAAGQELPGQVIHFNASLRIAGEEEPGIQVSEIRLGNGQPLQNDACIAASALAQGMTIRCRDDALPIASASVSGKPVCSVTLEFPYPFNSADQGLWGDSVIGYQPVVLAATLSTDQNAISWRPQPAAQEWLQARLFPQMEELNRGYSLLARLSLSGNFIWAESELGNLYLDGDAFGILAPDGITTHIQRFTGDSRRGGDLEMWFWLVKERRIGFSVNKQRRVSDSRVVKALSLLIHRDADELRGLLPSDYELDSTLKYDREEAIVLLAEAEYDIQNLLTIITVPRLARIGEILVEQLNASFPDYRQKLIVISDTAFREYMKSHHEDHDLVVADERLAGQLHVWLPKVIGGYVEVRI